MKTAVGDSPTAYLQDRPVLSMWQARAISVICPLIFALLGVWAATTAPVEQLENTSIDWRFDYRGVRPVRSDVIIVELDEDSRRALREGDEKFGLREHLPDAIEHLYDAGALVVAIDVWLDGLTNPRIDDRLAETIASTDVVLAMTHTDEKTVRAADVFLSSQPAEGTISVYPEEDGVLRRLPELLYINAVNPDGSIAIIPHFPLMIALYGIWQTDPDAQLELVEGGAKLGERFVNSRELVDYVAPRGAGWNTMTFAEAVRGTFDKSVVDGAMVLIGESRSIIDHFSMPLGGAINPGVYYHANVVAQILDGRHIDTGMSQGQLRLWIVGLLSLAAGLFAWNQRAWWRHRYSTLLLSLYLLAGVVVFLGGWTLAAFDLFERGVLAPLVGPVAGMTLGLGTGLAAQWVIVSANSRRLMERARRIEALFGQSVSQHVLEALRSAPERVMETQVRDVTVLFCDLRGFTAASSKLPPERVAAMLNEYFNHITSAVFEWDGFIDKFVGDEIMVVFSAPLPQEDHVERAVRAAIDLKRRLAELNVRRAERGEPGLACGVGIHTGPAAAGHIGSAQRSNYTVVGTTVNLASRIQSFAKGGEILVSAAVREQLPDDISVTHFKKVEIRGAEGQHDLFEVPQDGGCGL